LQAIEKDLLGLGYQIIAISPDRPEKLRETLDEKGLSYTLLSDSAADGARVFGLAWKLGADILKRYDEFGIDVEDASGETHHILPVPAVYIVGIDGTVQFQYVNPDHTVRIDPDVLLVAAKKAIK
jgi:peroxiredoxin